MATIVEVTEEGTVVLPYELLGSVTPHDRFAVEQRYDGSILLFRQPGHDSAISKAETDNQEAIAARLAAFDDYMRHRPLGPDLPDEALSREAMYD